MAVFKIVTYPDPVLLRRAEKAASIGERKRLLVRDMIDTMHAGKGVGLAANQIGIASRIFVASPDGQRGKELVFINPKIIRRHGSAVAEEGCLSLPGEFSSVRRAERVTIRAQGLDGKIFALDADGLLARILQHETDHLEGRLYVHRLSFFRRRKILKHFLSRARGNSLG